MANHDDSARRSARDYDPELLRLFDHYVHGLTDRRGFLEGAAKFAVAGLTASGLLEALSPRFAEAQQVAPTDAQIRAEYVTISSPKGYGKLRGYMVQPAQTGGDRGELPGVLVVHENRGLNPHIEDVARRLALENFVAFAPDALFPLGGYPGDEDKARELFTQLDQQKTQEDFVAAARHLQHHGKRERKLGVVGFCYGGGMANLLASRLPELDAAVPFYGSPAPLEKVSAIKAKLMLHFAETDERINAAWPDYEAALKASDVDYQAFTYPGTQHGFHNDTTPRYDQNAAQLAWLRTLELFNEHLRPADWACRQGKEKR
jgi:carboxymethylenebutenolidase